MRSARIRACSTERSAAWSQDGRTHFKNLLFRREWPHFYAFDVLSIDGEDLTGLPLLKRKRRLLRIMPSIETRLLYLDHVERRGCDLFRVACERDLEGIVAKWSRRHIPY
jgi:ATP-dependent DNA ligase